jgi:hypothetical protein
MYKKYLIMVDGLKVGIMELTPEDVKLLESDNDIKVMEV